MSNITYTSLSADPVAETGAATTLYYRGMGLVASGTGNNIDLYRLNAHGDVIKHGSAIYDYDAFGNQLTTNTGDTNPFRYCGEYQDLSSGLIYLRNRYYDPSISRFISEDTHWNPNNMIYGDKPQKIGERQDRFGIISEIYMPDMLAIRQSSNLYSYALNNPLTYQDPTGLSATATVVVGGITIALNSPAGQQLVAKAYELAIPVGQFVAQYGDMALQIVSTWGGTAIDAAGNAIQYAADKTGEAFNKAKNWAKDKISNATNGDPNKDPNKINQGMNNVRVLENTKIKGYQVSMDLERGGSGLSNIHVKVDNVKYFYNESVQSFTNSSGQRLPNSLRGNQQIINAFDKAKNLLNQGF